MRILILFFIVLGSVCHAELRTWTAVNGKEVEAEFVSNEKGIVKLKLNSGKVFEVPLNKLSKADQDFLKAKSTSGSLADNIVGKVISLDSESYEVEMQFNGDGGMMMGENGSLEDQLEDQGLTYKIEGNEVLVFEVGGKGGGISFSSSSPKVGDQVEWGPEGEKIRSKITKIEAEIQFPRNKPLDLGSAVGLVGNLMTMDFEGDLVQILFNGNGRMMFVEDGNSENIILSALMTYKIEGNEVLFFVDGKRNSGISFSSSSPKVGDQVEWVGKEGKITKIELKYESLSVKNDSGDIIHLKYLSKGDAVTILSCDKKASGKLVIPATIEGKSVTSIGSRAFYNCTSLTNITIPESVTSIGNFAFEECESLTSITIPDSVTSIGGVAFSKCINLTSITIGNGVTSIGYGVFYSCTRLTSITIPDSVTSIGEAAFDDCSSLTSITIPDNVTRIGKRAFSGCKNLTSITIPDSVTSIGSYTFRYCTSLTSITIGDSVTSIGVNAFYNCTSLTNITIPESVTSIGSRAFRYCTSLTNITIPESVTSIGQSAFDSCKSLTSITIPDGVTSIGSNAFEQCKSLTNITIGDSVTSIGSRAFYNCTSLTAVTFLGDFPKAGEENGGVFYKATPTIYRKPEAKGWGDTWGKRIVKLISEKP